MHNQFIASTEFEFLVVIFTMLGKTGFTSTYTGIFVFTAEVMPTPVRNIGMGACSMMSAIATIASPYFGDPLVSSKSNKMSSSI